MGKHGKTSIERNVGKAAVLAGEKVKTAWKIKRGAMEFLNSKVLAASKDADAKTRLAVERAVDGFLGYLTGTVVPCETEILVDEAYAFSLEKISERPSWSPDEIRFFERSPEGEKTYFAFVDLGVEKKLASGLTRACVFAALSHRDMTKAEMYEAVVEREEASLKFDAVRMFAAPEHEFPELCAAV